MASPAQPPPSPPSPPPPRRRKRSRSPSGERELGAQFDPQLSPPDRAISLGNNGSPKAKDGSTMNSAFSKDVSVDVQGAKSLFIGDQPIFPGPKGGIGLNSGSNMKLMFGNEHAPQLFGDRAISFGNNGSPEVKDGSSIMKSAFSKDDSVDAQGAKSLLHGGVPLLPDLGNGKPETSYLHKMTECQSFTYNELYHATSGFHEKNLMPQFGSSVYQGQLSSVGKVLVRVYDKVQEKLEEYKEGVMRRFSPSRAHQNIIQLIGSFSDEKRLILVYGFPFKVCLGDQLNVAAFEREKGGLATYPRYRIAVELAEALNHMVKQDIPLIPKLFTEEHVFVGSKGNPVLVDFIGVAQGVGRTFDSTLEIVRHYGILLSKLRAVKCANGVELPIRDEVWEKLEKECIQANEFKRPSPEYIVYVMKGRMKELFSLTSPMHDEFKLKHNLQW